LSRGEIIAQNGAYIGQEQRGKFLHRLPVADLGAYDKSK
jgi:hypothetical protein